MNPLNRCSSNFSQLNISIPQDCTVELDWEKIRIPPKQEIRQMFSVDIKDHYNRKIIFKNSRGKRCCLIVIDDCVIKDEKKCDYLLLVPDYGKYEEHFIELKGKAVEDAIEQFESTLKIICKKGYQVSRFAYVVCESVPRKTQMDVSIKKFHKRFNCLLRIQEKFNPIEI